MQLVKNMLFCVPPLPPYAQKRILNKILSIPNIMKCSVFFLQVIVDFYGHWTFMNIACLTVLERHDNNCSTSSKLNRLRGWGGDFQI